MKYQYKYHENISIISDNHKTAAYITILATPRSAQVQPIYKMTELGSPPKYLTIQNTILLQKNIVADIWIKYIYCYETQYDLASDENQMVIWFNFRCLTYCLEILGDSRSSGTRQSNKT